MFKFLLLLVTATTTIKAIEYDSLLNSVFGWDEYKTHINNELADIVETTKREDYLKLELEKLLNHSRNISNFDNVSRLFNENADLSQDIESLTNDKEKLVSKLKDSLSNSDVVKEFQGASLIFGHYNKVVSEPNLIRLRFKTSKASFVDWYLFEKKYLDFEDEKPVKSGRTSARFNHNINIKANSNKTYFIKLIVKRLGKGEDQTISYDSWRELIVKTPIQLSPPSILIDNIIKTSSDIAFKVNSTEDAIFYAECRKKGEDGKDPFGAGDTKPVIVGSSIVYTNNEINFIISDLFRPNKTLKCENLKPNTDYVIKLIAKTKYGKDYNKYRDIKTNELNSWKVGPVKLKVNALGQSLEWFVNKKPDLNKSYISINLSDGKTFKFEKDIIKFKFNSIQNESKNGYNLTSKLDLELMLNEVKKYKTSKIQDNDMMPYINAIIYDAEGDKVEQSFAIVMDIPTDQEIDASNLKDRAKRVLKRNYAELKERISNEDGKPDDLSTKDWIKFGGKVIKKIINFL